MEIKFHSACSTGADYEGQFSSNNSRHTCRLPIAEIIPGMTRASVQTPDGKIVNTCAYEVLIEILRYLKRAYWPFPWQTETDRHLSEHWVGGSGFTGAAQVRTAVTVRLARQSCYRFLLC